MASTEDDGVVAERRVAAASVLIEVADGVARITLDEPDRLNAVDAPMLVAVASSVEAFADDPAVRVITLTGAGRGFCAGANLAVDLASGESVDSATLYAAGRAVRALVACPKPTLALVGGVAAGVGVSLALACDYVVASESASFVLAFAKIGLMPDGGATALVAASIGRARAMRMALTAEKVTAAVAAEWGLVAECVAASEFATRGDAVAAGLAASGPLAVSATKHAINGAALDLSAALSREEEDQARLLQSSDFREGVAAFQSKRTPSFHGA